MKIDAFPGDIQRQFVHRPFTTKTGKAGCQYVKAIVLTDEQKEWLCKWFPEIENKILMKVSGLSHSALHRHARELGLTKSEKGMKRIKKRQSAQIKKVCEKNGWYDSIRGVRPSEQCLQASAKMWQEIREGKREHPSRILKRINPRKYKRWMVRRGQTRREAIRKERMRLLYGLERKTNLRNIVLSKYTRSQVCHRYNALKRGYIVMEDSSEQGGERYKIYYDKDTQRSPLFEKNIMNDGFKIEEYEDTWKNQSQLSSEQ